MIDFFVKQNINFSFIISRIQKVHLIMKSYVSSFVFPLKRCSQAHTVFRSCTRCHLNIFSEISSPDYSGPRLIHHLYLYSQKLPLCDNTDEIERKHYAYEIQKVSSFYLPLNLTKTIPSSDHNTIQG